MPNLRQQRIYVFDNFRLDAAHLLLYRNEQEISLAPKVIETLLALVERRGEVLSKDELMEIVWPDSVVEEGNLSQNLYLLRKTLGKTADGKPFIETLHRRGYRFNRDVASAEPKMTGTFLPDVNRSATSTTKSQRHHLNVEHRGNGRALTDWKTSPENVRENYPVPISEPAELTNALANETKLERIDAKARFAPELSNGGKIHTIARKRGVATALISLLIASSAFAYWFLINSPSNADAIESIAVLPFENASGDANLDYLSDGVSESLIDRLSELPQLKVIARGSSFKYRGENIDLQDIANKLGVQAVITGRVTQRGDNLSIRVELIDLRDDRQLWSEQYNRRATDALTIQLEIAKIVSEKLHLKLSGAQERGLAKQNTLNPQAYELLLKGRFARTGGRENLQKSIEYLQQAVEIDPNYALAYAELSFSYGLVAGFGFLDPKDVAFKVEATALKALELDENLAQAHLALAGIKQNAWDWQEAESGFRRAIELNPNLARAHMLYSDHLSSMGKHDQAITAAKRGKDLDPLSPRIHVNYGFAFISARQYDEAIEILKKTPALRPNFGPTHDALGLTYLAKGNHAEAIAELQEAIRLVGHDTAKQIYLGAAYARSGAEEKSRAILRRLEKSESYVSPAYLAILHTALGDKETAFASLEKAYAAHDLQLQYLNADPSFDPLRDDDRFRDLVRRVGLPQRR